MSRVRNAKNRFRALSRGAVTGEKMGGLLSKLKEAKNQEENTATGEKMGGILSKLKEVKNQEENTKDKKKVIINVFQQPGK